MTKNELLAKVIAVLTTLEELGTGTPESMVYLALGMNLATYGQVRDILLRMKWVTIKANYIELTQAGKDKAVEINNQLKVGAK